MIAAKKAAIVISYCLSLLLLTGLGTWQVSRGLHKDNVLSLAAAKHKDYPSLSDFREPLENYDYQSAKLVGKWLPEKYFLLDNRVHQQQLGYEVLIPFQLEQGQTLLINRGWISRQQATSLQPVSVIAPKGQLYRPKAGYTIGESIDTSGNNNQDWPKSTLYLDMAALSSALAQPLSPLLMVLDADHPDSLTRIWQPITIPPERHYAYAMQWYGLAIVFIVFGVIWYRRSQSKEKP